MDILFNALVIVIGFISSVGKIVLSPYREIKIFYDKADINKFFAKKSKHIKKRIEKKFKPIKRYISKNVFPSREILKKKKKSKAKKTSKRKRTDVAKNITEILSKINSIFPKIELSNLRDISLPKIKLTKTKRKKTTLKKSVSGFILGVVFTLLFISVPFQVYTWYKDLPRPELLSKVTNKSTKILDREGRLLYEIYIDRNYDPVPLSQIPDVVKQATIAIEDDKFYSHNGIRPVSMIRALKTTFFEGKLQGGSTITQQLVKNVLLTPERTLGRKAKEIVISIMAERKYTKDEILEMYLNNIPYGGTAWGIQSATQKFFGKDVSELDLAEAAFLAGLPSAPSSFSPFLGGEEKAKERQKEVLRKMVEMGYISKLDANEAYSRDLYFAPQQEYIRAPHFVNYVRSELERMYGSRFVDLGGLTVRTTLDLDLQDEVQEIVTTEVENNSVLLISNGAAVVMDTQNAEILAYVGSADYFDEEIDGNVDLVISYRQPGSSVKPITYSLAFQNGLTPYTTIKDEKTTFRFAGQPDYTPRNYDGIFHGNVTLRQALANSYNIPALKLARRFGPDNIIRLGNALGLKNWQVDDSYGISITLGGKEVRLLDLTNVFATFSRGGVYKDVTPFVSVQDANGYDIYKKGQYSERVLSEEVSYLITDILKDNVARSPAFGYSSYLYIRDHDVAVKTGTTDEKRDNWTIGYTPSFVVGVWVGNNDNSPMHPTLSSGLSGAAPIWNRIMQTLLENVEPEKFVKPEKVIVKVDPDCNNRSEIFIKGTAPTDLCE